MEILRRRAQSASILPQKNKLSSSTAQGKNAKGLVVVAVTQLSELPEPMDLLIKIKSGEVVWKSSIKYNTATPQWINETFVGFIFDRVSVEISLHEWRNEWNCKMEHLGSVLVTGEKESDYSKEEWYKLDFKSKKLQGRDIEMRVSMQVVYGPVDVLSNLIKGTQVKQTKSSGRKTGGHNSLQNSKSHLGDDLPRPADTVFEVAKKNDVALLDEFLSHASIVDVNMRNSEGFSVLHLACKVPASYNKQILKSLLAWRGIEVNMRCQELGNTALHYYCAYYDDPDPEVFTLFKQRGVLVDALNDKKESPAFFAIENNSIRLPLLSALLNNGADVHIVNQQGETLLHKAVRICRVDIVNLLLQYEPKLDQKCSSVVDGEDLTALELCKHLRKRTSQSLERSFALMELKIVNMIELEEFLSANGLDLIKSQLIKLDFDLTTLSNMGEDILSIPDLNLGTKYKLINAIKKKNESEESVSFATKSPSLLLKKMRSAETSASTDKKIAALQRELKLMKQSQGGATSFFHVSQLEYLEELGSGTFGSVYRGMLNLGENSEPFVVAIKCLYLDSGAEEGFKKEYQVMSTIQDHPNLVQFIGVCIDRTQMSLVLEYCSGGSLADKLENPASEITWKQFIGMSLNIVDGLNALHNANPSIIHRDLKPANLLLDDKGRVKVADFGLAQISNSHMATSSMKELEGTACYLAVEITSSQTFSTHSDVYALAVIFWEMLYKVMTGQHQVPYAEYPDISGPAQMIILLFKTSTENLRPSFPQGSPEQITDLISRSWSSEPEERLSLLEIKKALIAFASVKEPAFSIQLFNETLPHQQKLQSTSLTNSGALELRDNSTRQESDSLGVNRDRNRSHSTSGSNLRKTYADLGPTKREAFLTSSKGGVESLTSANLSNSSSGTDMVKNLPGARRSSSGGWLGKKTLTKQAAIRDINVDLSDLGSELEAVPLRTSQSAALPLRPRATTGDQASSSTLSANPRQPRLRISGENSHGMRASQSTQAITSKEAPSLTVVNTAMTNTNGHHHHHHHHATSKGDETSGEARTNPGSNNNNSDTKSNEKEKVLSAPSSDVPKKIPSKNFLKLVHLDSQDETGKNKEGTLSSSSSLGAPALVRKKRSCSLNSGRDGLIMTPTSSSGTSSSGSNPNSQSPNTNPAPVQHPLKKSGPSIRGSVSDASHASSGSSLPPSQLSTPKREHTMHVSDANRQRGRSGYTDEASVAMNPIIVTDDSERVWISPRSNGQSHSPKLFSGSGGTPWANANQAANDPQSQQSQQSQAGGAGQRLHVQASSAANGPTGTLSTNQPSDRNQPKFQLNVAHLNPMEALEQEREEEREIKLQRTEARASDLNLFFTANRLSPK